MQWWIVGCGYVGTSLARRLLAEGNDVAISRRDPEACRRTAAELGTRGIALDLAAPMPSVEKNSIVVCLAPPGPDPSREILNLVRASAGSRLVYVSSTAVYGHGNGKWVDETWPVAPITKAGQARVVAERGLPASAIALRVAGIYGPGRGLVARLTQGSYRIVGDGSAHVSRIHVDDLVEVIIRAGTHDTRGAVNVADDDPAPIGELADEIAIQLGVAAPPRVSARTIDSEIAGMLTADRRIANVRMKSELGVVLRYPSLRAALRDLITPQQRAGAGPATTR